MDNNLNINTENVKQTLDQYKTVMNRDYIALEAIIEELPKQALIRLVKMYAGCNLAREIAGAELLQFHPNEEVFIKKSMKLQDDCIGFLGLNKEIETKQQGELNGN